MDSDSENLATEVARYGHVWDVPIFYQINGMQMPLALMLNSGLDFVFA